MARQEKSRRHTSGPTADGGNRSTRRQTPARPEPTTDFPAASPDATRQPKEQSSAKPVTPEEADALSPDSDI